MDKNKGKTGKDMNRDPITGAPGAHPVGVGAGTTGGALAGAAVGGMAGPVGAAVGAVVGGVGGAMAGKAAAERVNPTAEENYWREAHTREPYYASGLTYDDYAPAYRTGWEGAERYRGQRFDDVESDLERNYNAAKGKSRLAWEDARSATRAAWHRVEDTMPGDFDRDGH